MSAYNSECKWCSKVIEQEFKEVAKISPSFLLYDGKKKFKCLTTILRDILHLVNKTNGMADIIIFNPQGVYNVKVLKADEYIDTYKDKSVEEIEFAYNTDVAAAGAEMGIKKGVVDLVRHLFPRNVWQTHLSESTGDNKYLNDVIIHDII